MSNITNRQKILSGEQDFSLIAEEKGGIVLGERRRGFFSVVEPVDTTINYVENPSFRAGDYPYKSIDAAVDRTFDEGYTEVNSALSHADAPDCSPMYGGWCKVTPTDGSDSGMYYSVSLSASTQYTFSCFVAGKKEHSFSVYVTDNSANLISEKKQLRGNNNWQRLHVTFETGSAGTYRLYLVRDYNMTHTTDYFYTSFWVCEDNAFLTLPFNGAYEEKEDSPQVIYKWEGVEWTSKSVRFYNAYNSGRERYLNDYGFALGSISGLGISGINHILEKTALDGSVWNSTKVDAREFTLSGTISARTLEERMTLESSLYDLLTSTSKLVLHQPTTLLFRVYNEENNSIIEGQTLYIYCRFSGGIITSFNNEIGAYNVNLSFSMDDPYIYSSMHKDFNIDYESDTITGIDYNNVVVCRRNDPDIYEEPFTITNDMVMGVEKGISGKVYYYGGNFSIGINLFMAVEYDIQTNTTTGICGILVPDISFINCSYVLPDGRIIFGGGWEVEIDSVPNTEMALIYDPSDKSYASIGAAFPASGGATQINSIAVSKDGTIFFAGVFRTAQVAFYIWDGSSYSSDGTVDGVADQTNTLLYVPGREFPYENEDYLFVGGYFDDIDSVVGTKNVAKYQIGTGTFSGLGNGGLTGAPGQVFGSLLSVDGYIYLVGSITGTQDGNVISKHIIKYNFTGFLPINDFLGDYTDYIDYISNIRENTKTGDKYVSIATGYYNFTTLPIYFPVLIKISGSTVDPEPIYMYIDDGYDSMTYFDVDSINNEIWAVVESWEKTVNLSVYSGNSDITINNGENVYPNILFTGSGILTEIYNHRTRKKISFTNYPIQESETIKLYLENYSKKPVKLISSINKNITRMIKQNSNINFYLTNGVNNIDAIYSGDSNSSIKIFFRERYLLLSKAIKEGNLFQ